MDGDLNMEELVLETQPSREGLNGGISGTLNGGISETNIDFAFYETEPASLKYESESLLTCCKHSLLLFSDSPPF